MMKRLIRREWTAAAADEWTKEDVLAAILSVLAFVAISIGAAYAFLFFVAGYILLLVAVILSVAVYWIIAPKLEAVSTAYEAKQARYLEKLDRILRWEEDEDG